MRCYQSSIKSYQDAEVEILSGQISAADANALSKATGIKN